MPSYFNHTDYTGKFRGKEIIILCAFGTPEQENSDDVTWPMKRAIKVLHGEYLWDIGVSVYQKGKVRGMPEVLER
ncbi:MAG: hypothetical protein JW712_07375 [Dehalococcoidales bacterium]|nr:hypothetical protein [Dehalococcoidales bacterium]